VRADAERPANSLDKRSVDRWRILSAFFIRQPTRQERREGLSFIDVMYLIADRQADSGND